MGAGYDSQVVNQSNAMKGAKGIKRVGFRVKDSKNCTPIPRKSHVGPPLCSLNEGKWGLIVRKSTASKPYLKMKTFETAYRDFRETGPSLEFRKTKHHGLHQD